MIYGVIYENSFVDNTYDLKPLGVPADDEAWTLFPGSTNIGTRNYLYIEDNTSTGFKDLILASGEGARWVYRYNTADGSATAPGDKFFDAHGDTQDRGVVAFEVYENTFTNVSERVGVDYRGGTGIIFNNSWGSSSTNGGRVTVREEHDSCTNPTGCDGSPCGDEVNNGYIWNNKQTSTGDTIQVVEEDLYECIEEDTNWWDDYGDSNFTKGLSSARPSTCSDDNCYWETDTRRLYRCDGDDNWVFVYTPYTYPHPLRTAAGPKFTGGGTSKITGGTGGKMLGQ